MRRLAGWWMSINPSRQFLQDWLREAAISQQPGARVLDAGAGSGPYRHLFDHLHYESADFAKVDKKYGELDYVCDLTNIPVEDDRFDLIISSQVLEHVPHPVEVLREFRRVLKPAGQVWLSAPLFYEEHEQPYDFFRYTQFAWARMASEAGMRILEIDWLEGYYSTLAYQLRFAAVNLPNWLLPIRVLFGILSGMFARMDLREPLKSSGMCKNYRVVLTPEAAYPAAK